MGVVRQRPGNGGSHRTAWWAREDSNCVPGTQSGRTGLCVITSGLARSQKSAALPRFEIYLTREQVSSTGHFVSESPVACLRPEDEIPFPIDPVSAVSK